jgi:DNA-binding NarL/FixJ family response regulator
MIRILLADDNPTLRSAFALLLQTRLGACIVGETSSIESSLTCVEETHPTAIIVDWELPDASGKEWIKALHHIAPALKVIVTSVHPEAAFQAYEAGADAFLCKTDSPEYILRVIQEICSHV